jgi:hypothetical protein
MAVFGKSEASGENVILTENGVTLAGTVRVVNDEAMKEMQFHERVKGMPWGAKETAKDKATAKDKEKVDESKADKQGEPIKVTAGVAQHSPSAVQSEVACQPCKGRHRPHTRQSGCRLYEEENVATKEDVPMASSPAAGEDETGKTAKKAKTAKEENLQSVPEVSRRGLRAARREVEASGQVRGHVKLHHPGNVERRERQRVEAD